MRDLKEIQAEVFRRSEKRIKARKQRRNRILMTCIPLVLGITVITAALWPQVPATTDSVETVAEEVCVAPYVWQKILVSGQGMHLSYENEETLQIIGFLDACTAAKPVKAPEGVEDSLQVPESATVPPESAPEAPMDNNTISGGRGEDTAESGNKHSVSDGVSDDYLVHADEGFTITIGNTRQYCLSGNLLADRTNNKTYQLTPEQAERLRDLLGVTQP